MLLAILLAVPSIFGHGGGLDKAGGHNDRKNGGYHFHRGPLAGQAFDTKADGLAALDARPQQSQGNTGVDGPSKAKREDAVYIPRTGQKYHAKSCRYLRRSSIRITLKAAHNRGLTPCSVCGGGQ